MLECIAVCLVSVVEGVIVLLCVREVTNPLYRNNPSALANKSPNLELKREKKEGEVVGQIFVGG
jgi:hypothetical protein